MASAYFYQDKELAEFFTDVEHLREAFRASVAAPTLTKRLLVIHGVGGVGKSSLLRMFRLHCKSINTPVALASGDEEKSALDVLARWTEDLKGNGIAFPSFGKTFDHYRAIQAKVDEQAKKAQDARSRAVDIAGKAASKTAEAAGGALAGAAIGAVIPGVGTAIGGALGGVLGGMGTEALMDWLHGFLGKPDIDLLLDPAKKLTDDLLIDIAHVADKQRLVLMLDTFEQMTSLDDWARDVAQRMPANVLLVIAGRALPNWSRAWQGWMANAQVEELKPMTEEVMRELIRRYYATMRGGEPIPVQVEAIIHFARGLPIVVTSAVQLWVKYGVEDFQSVKAEIVANLVDRLMEGVPKELLPALEAAAAVRWFDQPILRAVTGLADVREVYNELRRFPFVRTRAEGFALHDTVREIMDENLRTQDSERHCELHTRAAIYFEKRLEKAPDEVAERLRLERLYHRVRADEEAGIKLFQEMAEELVQYRLVNRLRALLNDTNTYALEHENSKSWREYYNARLAHLDARQADAEKTYQAIGENEKAEPKLRAYALCDWGEIAAQHERHTRAAGFEDALQKLERGEKLASQLDSKIVFAQSNLIGIYSWKADWQKAIDSTKRQLDFFQKTGDWFGQMRSLELLHGIYGLIGDWGKAADCLKNAVQARELSSKTPSLKPRLIRHGSLYLIWSGRYVEAEQQLSDAMGFARQIGDTHDLADLMRDAVLVLGLQEKYAIAAKYFGEAIKIYEQHGGMWSGKSVLPGFWGKISLLQGELEQAEQSLKQSLAFKKELSDNVGIPELLDWLAELYEAKTRSLAVEIKDEFYLLAESHYLQSLNFRWTGRRYFECAALTGLARVKHAQFDYAAIPSLVTEAEQLAQQYEYNDHLASLWLTQAHLAWEGRDNVVLPTQQGEETSPLQRYQHALIYAVRYNRFLMDEVLRGRPQGTPLRPIIPYCLERGEEGRQMLIALRDWWKTGINDISMPRPDTISPIPEGIPLLEAERLAREREPGDGSPQRSLVEQIEAVL